ncbi:MAG: sulfatase-like hydrolase/transferase [Bryobacterales bacterium]|nr:sulfatase-like hydrolase/transferase [Bryobacterales bacterium]
MRRRTLLQTLAALPLAAQTQRRKPNLIVILADDMGYGDIGCYGSPDVPTPHIDALAKNGTRFTDGYVSCAVCSPSRAALLTGRYQHRFGHEFNSGPSEREAQVNFGLPIGEKILPQYLAPAGYRSAVIGKWHLGIRAGYHPQERGFDEFFGFLVGGNAFITAKTTGGRAVETDDRNGAIPQTRKEPIYRGKQVVQEDRYLTDVFTEEGVQFIDRHRGNPFFLYMAYNAIHTPLHTLDKYLARVPHIKEEKHRLLAAMTVALDDGVGRIMAKLREHNLERDTVVVFLSDNGCPEHTGAGTNGPLNGEKVTYYEGGIRVPFVIQWPGKVPAGKVYRNPVVSRDIAPTFLAAAGVNPNVAFDGVDLLPYVNGAKTGEPHPVLYWRGGKARAIRKGKWKLLEFGDNYTKLYDLSKDLGEHDDVSSKNPDVLKELRGLWQQWSNQMMAPRWPPRYRELTVNGEKLNWEL